MAARGQKQHFINFDQLKVKYRGQFARIRTYCSVVERQTHTNITIGNARRGPMKFDIVGQLGAIRKAKQFIDGEFIDRSHRPRGAVSGPRLSAVCLDVDTQRALVVTDVGAPNLLTEEALRRHDLLTGTCQFRQFACKPCDSVWWRVVSTTKMVSQCRRCRKRYEALPRDREYGIGRFICRNCTHVFLSRCLATSTCACYECFVNVAKPYIHPKFQLDRPRTGHKHSCDLCNGKGDCPTRRKVVNASKEHDSTGSTMSTFLSQYNFNEDTAPCFSDVSDGTGSSSDHSDAGDGANAMPRFDADEQRESDGTGSSSDPSDVGRVPVPRLDVNEQRESDGTGSSSDPSDVGRAPAPRFDADEQRESDGTGSSSDPSDVGRVPVPQLDINEQ